MNVINKSTLEFFDLNRIITGNGSRRTEKDMKMPEIILNPLYSL